MGDSSFDGTLNNNRGEWAQLASGRLFPVEDPRPEDLHLSDVAHHLAQVVRFSGACREPFSVAFHLCNCAWTAANMVDEDGVDRLKLTRWALAHDIPEFIFGDHIRPVKRAVPQLVTAEKKLMSVVEQWLGLEPLNDREREVLRWIDNVNCSSEREALMSNYPPWPGMPEPSTYLVRVIEKQVSGEQTWKDGRDAFIHNAITMFPELAGPDVPEPASDFKMRLN